MEPDNHIEGKHGHLPFWGLFCKRQHQIPPHPKPAYRAGQQASPGRVTGRSRSTFIGKRISNHQLHRRRTSTPDDGQCIEDAFWKSKPLHGRQITSGVVLRAYRNDRTSLRAGFFLQKLCLQNILHDNKRKNYPGQVIQEFNRKPNRNNKQTLAIARFKADCCLRGLSLNGQQVSPDSVVKDYLAAKATLELARFKEHCCLRSLPLNGQPVTPDAVVKGYQATKATLELARFKAECCLRDLPLNGQLVTPDAVVKDYQATAATRELAHFKAECYQRALALNGQPVTPDTVIKEYERCGWLRDRDFFILICH
ncbi:hypothetical protein [Endozoicomonas sp. GU-1]|uniref:hypothetical protein n=1 Tax=Endozoicomonas sp. GU-1 TaxID=3009078 RepID=UPI0022B2DAD0|nr:hypothetical protein [Endozoicomonas sp. GU-1]WBA85860.1 hypothetical protein O3276_22005 [Endozoicomonas sp. GU-1]